MAKLEIHDARGRVRFVELSKDHPVLVGTSASCDVQLEGEGIAAVHGRIRWRGRRFKIEASPDAEFVELNGGKIVTATLQPGDELTIGPNRLYLMDEAAPATTAPAQRPAKPAKKKRPKPPADDATRVLPGEHASSVEATVLPPPAAPARRPSVFDDDNLLDDLDLDLPKAPAESAPIGKASRGKRAKEPGPFGRLALLLRRAWKGEDAPGREVILSSPTVIALLAMIGLLVATGFWLNAVIARSVATRTFNRAVNLVEDGDNATAIREFEAFLAKNPDDSRVGKARTLRALANVRQYIAVSGATWSRALEAAKEMVDQVGELPEFRDEKSELADLTLRIGEGLADKARRSVDPRALGEAEKALAEAESAVPLHEAVAGESAPAFLTKSRLPDLLNEARAAIRKAKTRVEALAAMTRAIDGKSAEQAYKARDALVRVYSDLSQDREVVERMVLANDLMRAAATVDPSRRPAEAEEDPDPLGPPTSLVLRSRVEDSPGPPTPEVVCYAVADGAAYAIDARNGAPIWRADVGLASTSPPARVPGDPSVLLVDARRDELTRRDARTGRLIWRQGLGEPVDSPPLVLGGELYQTLPSGRLLVLSLASGEVLGALDLKFPIGRTPAADESGRFLYVMGRKDCLFTIARDPLGCADVQYLGHAEGSIACAPVRLGRFLVATENDRIADGRWRVLVLDADGAKPRAVQTVDVPGWTWDPPPTSGSSIWAIGDRGGIEVFAAGDYSSPNPLRSLAKLAADAESSGPAFGISSSEREVWISAGRSGRFDLDIERGRLASRFRFVDEGPAAGPIQLAARRIILSSNPAGGGVSLRGIDPASGKADWETVVGAAWPTAPVAAPDGESLEGFDQAGRRIRVPRADLARGGFVQAVLPRPGDPRAPDGRLLNLARESGSMKLIAPRPGGGEVWAETPGAADGWARTALPSPAAAGPLPWSQGLLVPGEDGRAYLIDPTTGISTAEPLVVEFDRDRPGLWLAPAPLDADSVVLADDAGRVRRLAIRTVPDRRIAVEAEAALEQALIAAPACTESAVVVATADGSIRSLAARDLSPVGSWKLDAPIVGAPHAVDGRVVVFDASGGVTLLEREGRRAWVVSIGLPAVGSPLIRDGLLWLLDRSGRARALALGDGREATTIDLGVQPTGGLVAVGPDVLVPSGRGVLRPLKLEAPQEAPR